MLVRHTYAGVELWQTSVPVGTQEPPRGQEGWPFRRGALHLGHVVGACFVSLRVRLLSREGRRQKQGRKGKEGHLAQLRLVPACATAACHCLSVNLSSLEGRGPLQHSGMDKGCHTGGNQAPFPPCHQDRGPRPRDGGFLWSATG